MAELPVTGPELCPEAQKLVTLKNLRFSTTEFGFPNIFGPLKYPLVICYNNSY